MAADFNINQANCPMVYNILGRVLFKRYKTNLMICLYIVISLPFRRESLLSLTNLSTVFIRIKRLVEFVFVIFIYSKSFCINIDYVIIRVWFLLFLIISNPIKQLIGPRSLPFYSLRILFFILLILSCFLIICDTVALLPLVILLLSRITWLRIDRKIGIPWSGYVVNMISALRHT